MSTPATDRKQTVTDSEKCFHCGDRCTPGEITSSTHSFCCTGCKSVYELLSSCGMDNYYSYAENPGIKQLKAPEREAYAWLDAARAAEKILDYKSDDLCKVSFRIPAMHCASCIWLIENFQKLVPGVLTSRVNFVKREARFSYDPRALSLRGLAEQLVAIGYEPELQRADQGEKPASKEARKLIYQIGVAGFCFGNIMLLSLPEYLDKTGTPDERYRFFFGMVNLVLSLPVLIFSAKDYLKSAYTAVRRRQINLDVPISLGIAALWIRSAYEITALGGGGYMDSLAALVFFLLVGKWFQQKTYDSLSFERDYKSYFPISVQRIEDGTEEACGIEELKKGDLFRVRSGELIPADAVITEGTGAIDYSFVTGESDPVAVSCGEKVFAGGRQKGASLILEALKPVNQSYLTQLWNDETGEREVHRLEAFADRVGRKFTYVVLLIAAATAVYWFFHHPPTAWNALSAVLIIACPCALALSFPFAFGGAVRYLGRCGFYLKNGHALGKMAEVTDIIFDKTGTLTHGKSAEVSYEGKPLSENELAAVRTAVSNSGHPLSRQLQAYLEKNLSEPLAIAPPYSYREYTGMGIRAEIGGSLYALGKFNFVTETSDPDDAPAEMNAASEVHLSANGTYMGRFIIKKTLRPGTKELIPRLKSEYSLSLLSGDNDASRSEMEALFGQKDGLHFFQSPHDKKNFLAGLRKEGRVSAMVGDGLNDAGALEESDFGISVADDVFRFTPASDAIADAQGFSALDSRFRYAKGILNVVRASFVLSFLYNGIGLWFAVQGLLKPVIAAILMPISSVTVVVFVSAGAYFLNRKHLETHPPEKTDKNHVFK